jgi:HEAT repeat protein
MIIDQFNALHDSTAFDLLIKELDNDDLQIRTRAIKSLGEIGDKRVMDQLNDMYNTDNPLVFAAVEQALGTLNAEGILDKLMVNAKNVNPVIRYGAIAGLGERQENKAVEMLIDCMMNDRNLALRGYAMDLLSAKDNPLITQNIIRIIANNSAFTLRSKAIEYLSRMKDDQGYKILCSILPDENLQLRARAADALGVLGDQRAVPELLQAAKHEKNAWIRQRIIISIEKMSDTTAADALCALMTSEPSHFCRSSIAESLGLLKDRKAVPFLIKILDDSNKSVRISALHALTNISGINLGFDKNKWSEWFQGTKVLQK